MSRSIEKWNECDARCTSQETKEKNQRQSKKRRNEAAVKEIQTKQSRHSESVCRVHPARYRHDGDYTLAVGAPRGIAVRYGMPLVRIIHFPGHQLEVRLSRVFKLAISSSKSEG